MLLAKQILNSPEGPPFWSKVALTVPICYIWIHQPSSDKLKAPLRPWINLVSQEPPSISVVIVSGSKLLVTRSNHTQKERITDQNHAKITLSPFEGRVCWHWMCHSYLHATLSAHWLCKMFQGYPEDENQSCVTKTKSNADQSEIGEWFCIHFVKMLII